MQTLCHWMNAVESPFWKLAHRRHGRGVYCSIEYLKTSTRDFIKLQNRMDAKAFKCAASPQRLITANQRCWQRTRTSH